MTAQVPGMLSSTWETWIGSQAPGLSLAHPWLLWVSRSEPVGWNMSRCQRNKNERTCQEHACKLCGKVIGSYCPTDPFPVFLGSQNIFRVNKMKPLIPQKKIWNFI